MGMTISSKTQSIQSAEPTSISSSDKPQKTNSPAAVKEEAVQSANPQTLKAASQKQAKENASMQDLSGKMRSQELSQELNKTMQESGPKLGSTLLTPEKEALMKYYELDKKINAQSKKILDLKEEQKKMPKKGKEAMERRIEKELDKLGQLKLEQEQIAKKLPYDPKVIEKIRDSHHKMSLDTIRNMR